jgi:hypothetical protein
MPDAPTEADSQPEATPTASADTPEPTGNDAVTVENGRRRGRRRVMKKKKVKDEDGYLGKYVVCILIHMLIISQSRRRKPCGNHSLKTNHSPRDPSLYLLDLQAVRRVSLLARKAREALRVSSRRLDTSTTRYCILFSLLAASVLFSERRTYPTDVFRET